jgi:hypothetical protein
MRSLGAERREAIIVKRALNVGGSKIEMVFSLAVAASLPLRLYVTEVPCSSAIRDS